MNGSATLKILFYQLTFSLIGPDYLTGQDSLILGNLVKTEFTIPQSAAFDMLGVSPAQILTPSTIKEFKVDWSFSNWRTSPNLAIQLQPVWEIFYNRPSLIKYRKANYFQRTLSSLDISAATILDFNGERKFSYAAKINFYKEKDPLADKYLFREIEQEYNSSTTELRRNISRLNNTIKKTKNYDRQDSMYLLIDSLSQELNQLNQVQRQMIKDKMIEFQVKNWNSSSLEFSFGQAYSFGGGEEDSIFLNGKAISIWTSGCIGIGRKSLITAMFRFTQTMNQKAETYKSFFSGGVNFRYGSHRFNYFLEFFTADFSNFINQNVESIQVINISNYSIGTGGEWKMTRNVVLSYGIRLNLDESFKIIRITPSAGVSCLMSSAFYN